MLVVCLNISGMVQVRSAMRERELSIRQAIGATRRQLIQYLLSEAIIMAGLGAILASLVLVQPSVATVAAHRRPASASGAGGTESESADGRVLLWDSAS